MTTDDMLKVLAKVCIRATVVRVSIGKCFRIYLGDVIVEDATLPPHSLTYVPYWTVDAGTEEIVVLKAYGMLYKELEYYCRDVEFERR
jgi:hypothetical protein